MTVVGTVVTLVLGVALGWYAHRESRKMDHRSEVARAEARTELFAKDATHWFKEWQLIAEDRDELRAELEQYRSER